MIRSPPRSTLTYTPSLHDALPIFYTGSPLGLRGLRKVEKVVREEMDRSGAVELLMPTIQPQELWEETGRWEKFGGQLLKIRDRKEAGYCYAPTAEEVITDFARNELASYKQLPVNFYQVRSEEHTSELQSLMRISYAVFCLKKKHRKYK